MTDVTKHARSKLASIVASAKRGQTATVTALIVAIALGLAAYAAAASYATVSGQAAAHGVSLPYLNPIGIDGGLFGIIVLDIALTWIGKPIWWLRLMARLFAVGTIAANASAGWPSPVGVGLRIAAPALFVIIVEAGRTTLLRQKNAAERERRAAERKRRRDNRIPRIRWLLDFSGTYAIWKRMRLWREPSYAKAVNMELDRLAAIEKLGMKYGAGAWEEAAPANLVWMLTAGVRMQEALGMVARMEAQDEAALDAALASERAAREAAEAALAEAVARAEATARKLEAATARKRRTATARKPAASTARKQGAVTGSATVPQDVLEEAPADLDSEAKVLWYLEKGHSASKAGVLAGLTDGRGRQIARLRRQAAPHEPSHDERDAGQEPSGAEGRTLP